MQPTSDKKESARSAFEDFVLRRFEIELKKVTNDFQRSIYLTEFYIREIHNPTRTPISDEDIEAGLADGANDLGADFIYRDDGQVYIFQSKYHGRGVPVSLKDIQHFQSVLVRLRNPEWKRNTRVRELTADIDWEKDFFHLRFISLGNIEHQAQQQTDEPLVLPDDVLDLSDRVSVEYYGDTELRDEFRNALSQSSGIPGEITLHSSGKRGDRSGIIEVEAGEHRSFIMTVSANQIVRMHQHARDSLFTLNIRNFIGNTRTNSDIRKTAVDRGNLFFLYNNGVSCLARKAVLCEEGNALKTEGLQVINGAQTVKALVKAFADKFKNGEPLVLLRVTEVPKGYSSGGAFTSEVTRYNNTQNVIKVSDFKSNDPIQSDLKRKFDYNRMGKRVEYFPKRTDKKTQNSIPIRLEEFSKVIYAFLCDPVSFSGSTSFLFDESESGGYASIFGDGKDVPDVMPDEDFRLRSAIWWIAQEFDLALKEFKQGDINKTERAALERKWFLLYASRLVLQKSFGMDWKAQIIPFYKGDWTMDEGKEGDWFRELYDIAKESVIYVYMRASKDQTDFVHRNWMRSPKSAEALEDFILNSPGRKLPPIRGARAK